MTVSVGPKGLDPTRRLRTLFVRDRAGTFRAASEEEVRSAALRHLGRRLRRGMALQSMHGIEDYLRIKLGPLEHEVFSVAFVDGFKRLIAFKTMFRGSLRDMSVYPREVAKTALALNASGVILVHNHPSGSAEPSVADQALTHSMRSALALVDVQVVDHVIVTAGEVVSLKKRGML